jgi:hypothetical protein
MPMTVSMVHIKKNKKMGEITYWSKRLPASLHLVAPRSRAPSNRKSSDLG